MRGSSGIAIIVRDVALRSRLVREVVMRIALAVVGLAVLLAGSGPAFALAPGDENAGEPPELDRARKAADALTTELRARLMKEMAAGGPLQALRVCSESAQQIAGALSGHDLRVRRVSDRWRNPADAPDRWEAEQLRRLAAAHVEGKLPAETFAVVGSGAWRVLRYVKPIIIGGPCLSCHGEPAAMSPEVAALIRERYPHDSATGYHEGELRGAVSVTVAMP